MNDNDSFDYNTFKESPINDFLNNNKQENESIFLKSNLFPIDSNNLIFKNFTLHKNIFDTSIKSNNFNNSFFQNENNNFENKENYSQSNIINNSTIIYKNSDKNNQFISDNLNNPSKCVSSFRNFIDSRSYLLSKSFQENIFKNKNLMMLLEFDNTLLEGYYSSNINKILKGEINYIYDKDSLNKCRLEISEISSKKIISNRKNFLSLSQTSQYNKNKKEKKKKLSKKIKTKNIDYTIKNSNICEFIKKKIQKNELSCLLPEEEINDLTIDFNALSEISGGDYSFEKELIVIFLSDFPEKISQLKAALEKSNFDEIKIISHSLKSSVAMFGIESLRKKFLELETAIKTGSKEHNIIQKFKNDINIFEKIFYKLKKKFKKKYSDLEQDLREKLS